ncbi:MAG: Gfo/Idh/MocA family protein [Planctomycetota bacterium]|jgi:predicted dehydrogenase
MPKQTTRRTFIKAVATTGAAMPAIMPSLVRAQSANSKLNCAFVATGGKGLRHIDAVKKFGHNCTAYAEVDTNNMGKAAELWPNANAYQDYRKMFAKDHKNIDAVFIATPDHQHYLASMIALHHDIHCYTQKPLTWSIGEARKLAEAYEAKKDKLATQMGNQGHAKEGWRVLYEWYNGGILGDITRIDTWTNRPVWPQGLNARPEGSSPVPSSLDWDVWIGPAQMRPYFGELPDPNKPSRGFYHPFSWRGWWDFGAGALGDMGCHTLDGTFFAFEPAPPISAEPLADSGHDGDYFPQKSTIKWEFPAKGATPGFEQYWYDGGLMPEAPKELEGRALPKTGNIYYGTKAVVLMPGDYGDPPQILPRSKHVELLKANALPPKTLERAPSNELCSNNEDQHHLEFFMACTGEKPPTYCKSNFAYAGPMTEALHLGNLALRVRTKIKWNAKAMKTDNEEANKYIWREPRKGWRVQDCI